MSEYIKLDDTIYFSANTYHALSGSYIADETPAWYVYESGATQILNGNMTARNGIVGSYWGNFIASAGNGFVTDRYYDVQVSGKVDGISGFSKVKDFVLGDIYDGNIVQVSGVNISLTESIDANLVTVKGEDFSLNDAVSVSGIVDSNVVQVSGEYVDKEALRADVSGLSTFDPAITAVAISGTPIDANLVQISGSTSTLTNFGYTYDGTGYENDYAPAQQQQLDNIANVGAAINATASSYTLITGSQTGGTYESTLADDSSYHIIEDAAGTTDLSYNFNVGSDGIPVSVTWNGYINDINDVWNVYASGQVTGGWVQVGSMLGTILTTEQTNSWQLTTDHVDSDGNVRVRFYSTEGTVIATDRLLCSYSVVYRSVGYANGSVWIDTVDGTAGTTSFINGTADKPSNSLSNGYTIANNLGLKRFYIINGSSITLDQAYTNYSFYGNGRWFLNLNNQDIKGLYVQSANITGSGYLSDISVPIFSDCTFGNDSANVYLPRHVAVECSIYNPNYAICISSGISIWDRCVSSVAGNETPSVEFVDEWVDFNCRAYMGGLQFNNMQNGNRASFDCPAGQLKIGATCTGGELRRAGFNRFIDYAGGVVTVTDGYGMTIDTDANGWVWLSGVPEVNVVQVSGEYVTIGDFRADSVSVDAATIWTYETRALTEAVSVSGIPDVNVIQVSGEYVDKEALRADISSFENDIYFANIKYISDLTNNSDEFAVQWFKNDQPISSGDLTEPCISVYNTSNGNSLIINQSMNYASSVLGVVRHNETPMVMVSGEPYLIETSGTIDSVVRIWKNIVGIDLI